MQETSWACAKVAGPGTRLALLVMLKCYQRLGYFARLERAAPEVAGHVHAWAAELPGERTGPLGRQPDRMVRRCRELVREQAGAVWDPGRVRAVAETAMRQALQSKDNPADVINVALEVLSAQRCELPAYLTLDRGYQRRIGGWKARRQHSGAIILARCQAPSADRPDGPGAGPRPHDNR